MRDEGEVALADSEFVDDFASEASGYSWDALVVQFTALDGYGCWARTSATARAQVLLTWAS